MQLIKIVVNTDWKYRATHEFTVVGEGTEKELCALMDKKVHEMILDDLKSDNEAEDEPLHSEKLLKKCEKDAKLAHKTWEDAEMGAATPRWEMKVPGETNQRMFCGGQEGESWSISFTILP